MYHFAPASSAEPASILRRAVPGALYEQVLSWDEDRKFQVVERLLLYAWPENTTEDIEVTWDESIDLCWVDCGVGQKKPFRIRSANTRAAFFEALQSFANPGRFTVQMGELST